VNQQTVITPHGCVNRWEVSVALLVAVITTSPIMAVVINLTVLEAVDTSGLIVAVAANISQVIMALR
jgi:hypothetical protein